MMKRRNRVVRCVALSMMLFATSAVSAQNLKERGEVRRGSKAYEKEDFEGAESHFERAVKYAPGNFESRYNLGSAKFKVGVAELAAAAQQQQQQQQQPPQAQPQQQQQPPKSKKMGEAEKLFAQIAADSLLNEGDRAQAYYNLGNSQLAQQKLEEALESYKSSMRLDPTDQEAKYNYAYTKALLQQQQDQQQDQQQNQDQDQDQNKDENQDQDQQNQDQNNDQQDQNQDQEDKGDQDKQDQQPQDPKDGEGDQQPSEGEISDQEQQQMLDAIQAQEDKTQDDMKERARAVMVPGAKNW